MKQYDIFIISLDPATGHELKKTRPCVIISPDEMNRHIATVIIAPVTSRSRDYPSRVPVGVRGREGWIVLDQVRAVDKRRLLKRIGALDSETIGRVKDVIREMLVD